MIDSFAKGPPPTPSRKGRGDARALFLSLCLLTLTAQANDWPACGHDNAHTSASEEPLRLPLRQAWVHWAAQPPSPAWPQSAHQDYGHKLLNLTPSVTYDRVFQVAAAGGAVFFASSAGDEVCCLDAATGARRWSFVTEGPVRLAPTLAGDKVLAGSDDGWVYCLAAADGTLAWRYRLGPREARLPGNGRMISRWPVRTGILVENGTGYCAGGLFPVTEGVYLAAFDVATGREDWKRKVDVAPQGCLAAAAGKLLVPTFVGVAQRRRRDEIAFAWAIRSWVRHSPVIRFRAACSLSSGPNKKSAGPSRRSQDPDQGAR